MALKHLILGFLVKIITGFDDTIVHVPVIASITKTRRGRVAFSIGILAAIIMAIVIAMFFSEFIQTYEYYRHIMAVLIFALAFAIYFEIFVHKPKVKMEKSLVKLQKVPPRRLMQLVGIGFVAASVTVLDDIIAYSVLFVGSFASTTYAIAGILAATVLELLMIIYFAKKINKIKYKKEIASLGLIVIGILLLIGVI